MNFSGNFEAAHRICTTFVVIQILTENDRDKFERFGPALPLAVRLCDNR